MAGLDLAPQMPGRGKRQTAGDSPVPGGAVSLGSMTVPWPILVMTREIAHPTFGKRESLCLSSANSSSIPTNSG